MRSIITVHTFACKIQSNHCRLGVSKDQEGKYACERWVGFKGLTRIEGCMKEGSAC